MAKIGQPSPQGQSAVQQPLFPQAPQAQPPVQQFQQAPFDPNQQYVGAAATTNGYQQAPVVTGQYVQPAPAPVQYAPQPPVQQFQPPVAGPVTAPAIQPPSFGGQMGAAVAGPSAAQMLGGIDFSQVSEGNFITLPLQYPDGNPVFYEAVIDKIEQKPTQAGAPMVVLKLKVTFPEAVGAMRVTGAGINDNVTFSDNALWKLKGLLRSCGLLSDDGKTCLMKDWSELVGNIVRFQTRHDEYPEGSKEYRSKVSSGYSEGYETPGLSGAQAAPAQAAPAVAQPMQPSVAQPPTVAMAFGQQPGPNFGLPQQPAQG